MALTLTPVERERLDRRGTESIEAYDYFLRGRELWRRLTREANTQAQVMLRRAVELDPQFASAYAPGGIDLGGWQPEFAVSVLAW